MLGIVIANWNGEKLIDECLKSLENQSFKAFKLYIIDNNSKDKSKEVIKRYNEKGNVKFVFVSNWAKNLSEKLIGIKYNNAYVIPCNIDTDIFKYNEKTPPRAGLCYNHIIHRKEPLPMLLFTRVYGYYYGCAYGYQVRLAL